MSGMTDRQSSAGGTGAAPGDLFMRHSAEIHPLVLENLSRIAELCRRHRVKRLDLFGSAAAGEFHAESSDLDFVVEFLPDVPKRPFAGYFELKEDLETLFDRKVDLVENTAIHNRYFREEVDETKVSLYAA